MAWTTDQDIKVTFVDKSVREIVTTVSVSKCSFIFAGFSSDGDPNITTQYNSTAAFTEAVGSDITSVEKYGYPGLYAYHALAGGAEIWWCRLMPSNAKKASSVVSVSIKEDDAIPVFKRNDDNSFELDDEGNKIPVMIPDPDHVEEEEDPESDVPMIQKTTEGYRIKWTTEECKDELSVSAVTSSDGWTKYPLFYFTALYPGAAGNRYGFKFTNNFTDDERTDDGRRYYMDIYRTSATNVIENYDQTYFFALNPDAIVSKYTPLKEGFQEVYLNRNASNQYKQKMIQIKYFYKNYLTLIEKLSDRFVSGEKFDIDILTARDKYQIPFDEIIMDEDTVDFREGVVFLEGGHDGSLGLGNEIQTSTGPKTVDEEHIKETKIQLLKDFYTGKIDVNLEDCRKIQGNLLVDCNFPLEIKRLLPTLVKYRQDVLVLFDCGITKSYDEMTRMVRSIKSFVDTSQWNYSIWPHCGDPVDSEGNKDIKVTQTYETVNALPLVFNKFGDFSTYAGYYNGVVNTFIPDWHISNNTLKQRAKPLGINFITDYGNVNGKTSTGIYPLNVDADFTLYNENNSVMKSFRNSLVAADLIKMVRTIFIKYRFGKSVEDDIDKANVEVNELCNTRYPKEFKITPNIYQTERGKITRTTNCYIKFIPPDQSGDWDITIEANRNDG